MLFIWRLFTRDIGVLVICLLIACNFEQGWSDSSADTINSDLDTLNSGQLTLQVEHSLDGGSSFSSRGSLLIHSLRAGSASMETLGDEIAFFGQAQKDALRDLCGRDELYLLRLIGSDGSIYRTATHACNLVKSGKI